MNDRLKWSKENDGGTAGTTVVDKRLGKSKFTAYQASARGGVVRVRVRGDRAFLGGRAVILAKGELVVE